MVPFSFPLPLLKSRVIMRQLMVESLELRAGGVAKVWTAATYRRFPPMRHVASFQSAVVPAHSKILAPALWQHLRWIYNDLKQFKPFKTPYFLSRGGVQSHAG